MLIFLLKKMNIIALQKISHFSAKWQCFCTHVPESLTINDDNSFEQPSADADRLSEVYVRVIVTHIQYSTVIFVFRHIFFAFHEAGQEILTTQREN